MSRWTSRKFLVAVGGAAVAIAVNLGMPEAMATRISETVIWIVGIYVGAEGAADIISRLKNP